MTREKLSAVIITLNEEANIKRCLNSLDDLADEIVVVDSGSTDGTEVIVKEYPQARFISQPFLGYGPQKNFAAMQAQNNIVLSLDADEALSGELYDAINHVLDDFKADGYTMNRRTWYAGRWVRHSGWYPDKKLRLWRKDKGRWSDRQLHESVSMQPGARTAHLKGDILHYSYPTISCHVSRINKYSDMAALEAFNKGRKINLFADIIINPFFTFLKKYFVKLGFLDGYAGFAIAIHTSYGKYLKYAKLKELWDKKQGLNEKHFKN